MVSQAAALLSQTGFVGFSSVYGEQAQTVLISPFVISGYENNKFYRKKELRNISKKKKIFVFISVLIRGQLDKQYSQE
jgi:hypothetical protein